MQQHFLVGQQIENYLIEDVIGDGGMGTVFRAQDVDLARPVALKVMHPQYAAQDQFQERFQQEAKAAARLNHPSIVRIYQFGRESGYLYIVMELVEGVSLAHYLQQLSAARKVIKLKETLLVLAQVAEALDFAHRGGVIHRDVKPDNILVRKLDRPEQRGAPPLRAIVTDFGLAKLTEGGIQTQTGTFIGTLPYMSPEQVLGQKIDGRSDIYSLGVVLYELATGQLPLDIRTPSDAVIQHMNTQPVEPHLIRPGLPFAVERIILTALAKNPDYRYENAAQVADALREAASKLSDSDITTFSGLDEPVSLLTTFEAPDRAADQAAESAAHAHPAPLQASAAAEPQQPAFEPAQLPDEYDRIVVIHDQDEPRTFPLDKRVVCIGRAPDNDLILPSMGVSYHHARLERHANGWTIADLDSTNGVFLADVRLSPNEPAPWPLHAMVRISDSWLQLLPGQPGDDQPLRESGEPHATPVGIRVRLPVPHLSVAPGSSVTLPVQVHNQGRFAGSFLLSLTGIPDDWLLPAPALAQLAPAELRELSLTIRPPLSADSKSGRYPLSVRVSSQVGPDEQATAHGDLTVTPFHAFKLSMQPAPGLAPEAGVFHVHIDNESNTVLTMTFAVESDRQACWFNFEPPRLITPVGQRATTLLRITPRLPLTSGRSQKHAFTLVASPVENAQVTRTAAATWVQKAARPDGIERQPTARVRAAGCLMFLLGLLLTAVAAIGISILETAAFTLFGFDAQLHVILSMAAPAVAALLGLLASLALLRRRWRSPQP